MRLVDEFGTGTNLSAGYVIMDIMESKHSVNMVRWKCNIGIAYGM